MLCLKLLKLRYRVLKLRCCTKGQIMYKKVGVGGRPPATGCKAGMQLPPSRDQRPFFDRNCHAICLYSTALPISVPANPSVNLRNLNLTQ